MIEPAFFIFSTLKYKRFQALRFAATFVCLLLFVVDLVSAQADYPLGGITLYVAPGGRTSGDCKSWARACDLSYALNLASLGDEVWVRKGVYKPTSSHTDRYATFQLENGVSIYGGFAGYETSLQKRNWEVNITVLSGDIDNNDITDANGVVINAADTRGANSYHIVTADATDESARLDGFVITAGMANLNNTFERGGGIYNNGGSPSLSNLTISGNLAQRGGGMYNENAAAPRLSHTTFRGNQAYDGGGMYNFVASQPSLVWVQFQRNVASNAGGAIHNSAANLVLFNVIFHGNAAPLGGGVYNNSSSPRLANAIFAGNWAGSGAGIYNKNSSLPVLDNVTMSANQAADYGGAIYNDLCQTVINNSILWGNKAYIYADQVHGNANLYHSLSEGGCPSSAICDHVMDADPDFVRPPTPGADGIWATSDDDYGNLRLSDGSLALDSGNNSLLPPDLLDLDNDGNLSEPLPLDLSGFARLHNAIVDLGAYEYSGYLYYLPLTLR
jgi:predicted outer membrane repeat protein